MAPLAPYQTPGVYIVEQNAFPDSVVTVATAIPAFVGYTEKASYQGKPLANVPTRVESLQDFVSKFGAGFLPLFNLVLEAVETNVTGGTPASLPAPAVTTDIVGAALTGAPVTREMTKGIFTAGEVATSNPSALPAVPLTFPSGRTAALTPQGTGLFYLYHSLRLFYQNGGGPCYIVSIGGYDATPSYTAFQNGIAQLEPEQDPTMLLCPDALMLSGEEYYQVVQDMLQHCADVQKRVALLDVYGGGGPGSFPTLGDDIDGAQGFRTNVGQDNLKYGIAYFPWVNTTVVAASDLSFRNMSVSALAALATLLPSPAVAPAGLFADAQSRVTSQTTLPDPTAQAALDLALDNKLKVISPEYKLTLDTAAAYLGTLPVAPAIAGVYTAVDSSRGVWKAPANVSLNAVIKPTVAISDAQQAGLNVDAMTGKSINAIRAFKGLGNLVWGARTLDGNSEDWRYVNVRRTMIMIEQSLKLAARNTVFEPNDANTWATFRSMLNSFLFNLWKQGALAGAKPDDAYSVQVGLGTTMTADDILNGIMNVTVLVALVRPAEFIMLTFKQQMQVS